MSTPYASIKKLSITNSEAAGVSEYNTGPFLACSSEALRGRHTP
jgi:hypothetical protein